MSTCKVVLDWFTICGLYSTFLLKHGRSVLFTKPLSHQSSIKLYRSNGSLKSSYGCHQTKSLRQAIEDPLGWTKSRKIRENPSLPKCHRHRSSMLLVFFMNTRMIPGESPRAHSDIEFIKRSSILRVRHSWGGRGREGRADDSVNVVEKWRPSVGRAGLYAMSLFPPWKKGWRGDFSWPDGGKIYVMRMT